MHKKIAITCIALSFALILEQFRVWDSLLLFLLVGTIPGTNWSLPPFMMLTCLTFAVVFGSLVMVSHAANIPEPSKKTLPRKRYSRI